MTTTRNIVPPPPVASFEERSTPPASSASKRAIALDGEFLGRIYVSSVWAGTLLALCVMGVTRSVAATVSFAAGIALGALLLKSQEIFVRRFLTKSAAQNTNSFSRLPLGLLLGAKYLLIFALLGLASQGNLLWPAAFALGFVAEQMIIAAKVLGRFLANRNLN